MDFISLLNTIATLFILIVAGYIAGKLNVIDEVASKKLSNLIIKIAQPFLLISSLLGMETSKENLILGGQAFAAGMIIHSLMAVIAFVVCIKFKNVNERKLSEFAMVFANVGFIGFPIVEALYGAKGLFMGAFYVLSFNIMLWTWGIAILARKRTDIKLTVKKIFVNYGTVPSVIGFIIYAFDLELPVFIQSGCSYLAALCTPISVMITGALLSRRTLSQIFLMPKIYYISFIRLIVIPLIMCVVAKLIGMNSEWILFITAVTALPCASTISMLAEIHDISPGYAAQAVGTSSLLSILTMPCVLLIAQQIVNL